MNFVLGFDPRGFFLGTINGNGSTPFVHVTVNEIGFDAWNQLAVVKESQGFQKFYLNGALVHTDENAVAAGKIGPFRDVADGEPVRLAMPLGGLIGEAWTFPRELSPEEIHKDFLHHGMHWGVPKGGGNSQSMPTMRPDVLDHTLPLPVTFYEFTALIAPRPLLVGEAVGERRPMEEENSPSSRSESELGTRWNA